MAIYDAGTISAGEIANWSSHLEEASQAGHFFCAITGFGVSWKKTLARTRSEVEKETVII